MLLNVVSPTGSGFPSSVSLDDHLTYHHIQTVMDAVVPIPPFPVQQQPLQVAPISMPILTGRPGLSLVDGGLLQYPGSVPVSPPVHPIFQWLNPQPSPASTNDPSTPGSSSAVTLGAPAAAAGTTLASTSVTPGFLIVGAIIAFFLLKK